MMITKSYKIDCLVDIATDFFFGKMGSAKIK